MQPQSVYNGFTDSDRLSLAATERFLDVTHRQYAARCTEFSSIRGVFTDEPHRGMVFSDFSDPGEERRWSLPWTDNLPEAFEAAYGEPLLPDDTFSEYLSAGYTSEQISRITGYAQRLIDLKASHIKIL